MHVAGALIALGSAAFVAATISAQIPKTQPQRSINRLKLAIVRAHCSEPNSYGRRFFDGCNFCRFTLSCYYL